MRIGELVDTTGVSARLLRYYEQRGLLSPTRGENGYREYPDTAPGTVRQIRGLLGAGLGTGTIRDVLPCGQPDGSIEMCPKVKRTLENELVDIEARISCLDEHRLTLARHLGRAEGRG